MDVIGCTGRIPFLNLHLKSRTGLRQSAEMMLSMIKR